MPPGPGHGQLFGTQMYLSNTPPSWHVYPPCLPPPLWQTLALTPFPCFVFNQKPNTIPFRSTFRTPARGPAVPADGGRPHQGVPGRRCVFRRAGRCLGPARQRDRRRLDQGRARAGAAPPAVEPEGPEKARAGAGAPGVTAFPPPAAPTVLVLVRR